MNNIIAGKIVVLTFAAICSICSASGSPLVVGYIDGNMSINNVITQDVERFRPSFTPSQILSSSRCTQHLLVCADPNKPSVMIDIDGFRPLKHFPNAEPVGISDNGKVLMRTVLGQKITWQVSDGNGVMAVSAGKEVNLLNAEFCSSEYLLAWGTHINGNGMVVCFDRSQSRVYEKSYGSSAVRIEKAIMLPSVPRGLVFTSKDSFKDAYYPNYYQPERIVYFAMFDIQVGMQSDHELAYITEPVHIETACSDNGKFIAVVLNDCQIALIEAESQKIMYRKQLTGTIKQSSRGKIQDNPGFQMSGQCMSCDILMV